MDVKYTIKISRKKRCIMRNLNKKKIALLTACVVSAVGHMDFAAEADKYDE